MKIRNLAYLASTLLVVLTMLALGQDPSPNTQAPAAQGQYTPKFPGDPARSDSESGALGYMRRGADLLVARTDVDSTRLAFVGHSYNAGVGGILSGVDKRFKAFVLMAGGLSDALDLKSEDLQKYRLEVGPEKFDAFIARNGWLDPGLFVAHAAPATVFLQYGGQEKFLNPERARAYAAIVSEPKKLKIYDAPHALNAEATRDRIAFLCEQLRVKPPEAKAVAGIPELYQPPEPVQTGP